MDRSKYPEATEVHSEHLIYTEETKIEAIKKIVTTLGVTGPVKGLSVLPDTLNPNQVMVLAGVGYTYSGEYLSINTDVHGVVVSNSLGGKTYVSAKITESEVDNLPNVVTGEVSPTRVTHTCEIKVFSEADWLNLVNKDFYCLLAIVIGSGGFVRASDIFRAIVVPNTIMFTKTQPISITGVKIKTVSNNTSAGTGILSWSAANKTLSWNAPLESSYGQPISIGIDGIYKLFNSLGTSYIRVIISAAFLPISDTLESFEVLNILGQYELALGTANDNWHRSMMGTGTASPSNAHGQTLDDFEPGEIQDVQKHQIKLHSAGIIGIPGSTSLQPQIFQSTMIKINPLDANDVLFTSGIVLNTLAASQIDFAGSDSGTYYVYVAGDGLLYKTTTKPINVFIVCQVEWSNISNTLSQLEDIRVWGSVYPLNMVQATDDVTTLDPANALSFVIADNLAKIRYMIKAISGEVLWTDIPDKTLYDIAGHAALNLLSGDLVHGVKNGTGGGIDADFLDGYDSAILPVSNTRTIPVTSDTQGGKLHGGSLGFIPWGHNPDVGGVNADMVDDKHWFEIKQYIETRSPLAISFKDLSGNYLDSVGDIIGTNLEIEVFRLDNNGEIIIPAYQTWVVPSSGAGGTCFSSCFSSCDCDCGSLCRW